MGAGRKAKTSSLQEKSNLAVARNITKNELGAVIFGCKHHTIQECLRKLLFGLPASHISYVKHITPGLPLFLFNYSDRKLHGIFEAASQGQMFIDEYAWIDGEGAKHSPYGAQVRVRVLSQCRLLREEEFKPVIENNYYDQKLFWFELDKRQASRLTKLFSASPLMERVPRQPIAARSNNMFDALPSSDVEEVADESNDRELEELSASPGQFILKQDTTDMNVKESHGHSYASILVNKNASVASQLCQQSLTFEGKSELLAEACVEEPAVPDDWDDHFSLIDNDKGSEVCAKSKSLEFQSIVAEAPGKTIFDKTVISTNVIPQLMEEIEELKVSQLKQCLQINALEHELIISKTEIQHLKERCNMLESGPFLRRNYCVKEGGEFLNSRVDESVFIVGGFDGCSWIPTLSSYSLTNDLVKSIFSMKTAKSYASAAKLNDEIYVFGGVHDDVWYDTVESYNPTNGQCVPRPSLNRKKGSPAGASLCGKIFAIGGGDGMQCFSEVEELNLSAGRWILTSPMLERRFGPGAVDLNSTLYVAGGFDGTDYLRSVERYDPRERSWTRLMSMSAKRGCNSLVAFNEKLYALGGYDGTGMVPTVEVFDPRVGLWMKREPMKKPRGNFGSVVLGRKIYVIGGVDSRGEVLDSMEYFEEGRGWQVADHRTLGKRSFFSALVL